MPLWIGGPPGAGKSTVARLLARRHGLRWYNADAHTWEHRDRALAAGHAEAVCCEALPMIRDDVRALPASPLTVVEGTPVTPASTGDRAVWLLPTPSVLRSRLAGRDLPAGVRTLYELLAEEIGREVRGHRRIVVDGRLDVDDTVARVRPRRPRPWAPPGALTVVRRFACECGAADCRADVALPVGEYRTPVLATGHVLADDRRSSAEPPRERRPRC